MLLTDKEALEKANRIIKESGENAKIEDYFWVRAEDEEDDIFCYYVLFEALLRQCFLYLNKHIWMTKNDVVDITIMKYDP